MVVAGQITGLFCDVAVFVVVFVVILELNK